MKTFYVVKYSGPFGFIKPWTAVRDSETFSQQFLTPSTVEGIEKKLFPELLKNIGISKIKGHRLSYDQISEQQEVTQTRGWNSVKKGKQFQFSRDTSILLRGVLINPVLHLLFDNIEDAEIAMTQHICLCRNEDLMFPIEIMAIQAGDFDTEAYPGYELVFGKTVKSFIVGYHRLTNEAMYGWLKIVGTPVRTIRQW
ncbi:hypothetical protein LNQ81_12520 [Myroides sp. M-43]|uniref:hypothetical protein n=1 Tax=Myroides oncorhynchi TaxID=2893756 RepID=UPI001E4E1517|nr:hypothetical protein [Myroides oncorhynchi]MCC9043496.1 hypothetical protein [Myroides oncorhynchi]